MGPVSCLIIQDDPPSSGGQEAKYTGGLSTTKYRVRRWRCPVLVLCSLVTVHQFRDLGQGWALSLRVTHAGLTFL